ncbi:MCE family protein [Nocardia sp. CDC159]|uniref:MCE family protein n=1 Tax=Nocardia pulmonis TaxID=2951408 RepID=A0A9X2IU70_9NOCA|nr:MULTISPECIES: MCE family protein [Nocardia]MCM6772567.1 MCE family protein [Nocardia pulmonis]MCM6784775.1 MCE family protein [Nocardia sp. CDC159]
MGNDFELDGRGPSTPLLVTTAIMFTVVCVVVAGLLVAKSNGSLDERVSVTAELGNVGDGLPRKSDVKYRGVLVGMVRGVTPARPGAPNIVHIDLKPEHAQTIPRTVTARIVPSNAFAVSSVQLVDHGDAPPLRAGDRIGEDHSLPTQLFQTTLAKVRELVAALGRADSDRTLGLLRTLADATAGQGPALTAAVDGLNRVTAELNGLGVDDGGPATLPTWRQAIAALRGSAPELVDALHATVAPLRTLAERQAELTNLLTGARHTAGTVDTALGNHIDQLVDIGAQLTPVLGVLADDAAEYPAVMLRMNTLIDTFFRELWTRSGTKLTFSFKMVVSLTPLRLYTRPDCPTYGDMRGPSCDTAPETTPVPDVVGVPDARSYVPPPGTVLPPPASAADRILLGPLAIPASPPLFTPAPGGTP